MRGRWTILILIAVVVSLAMGCPKRPVTSEPAAGEAASPPSPPSMGSERADNNPPPAEVTDSFPSQQIESEPLRDDSIDELNRMGVLETIYFDYDQSDLDDEDRRVLQENAAWLQANPGYNVAIEGHTDERGTIEYNLSLGDRRAKKVREYMRSLGIAQERMRVITWGEERPAIDRTGEAAWSKNRRAEFVIEQ